MVDRFMRIRCGSRESGKKRCRNSVLSIIMLAVLFATIIPSNAAQANTTHAKAAQELTTRANADISITENTVSSEAKIKLNEKVIYLEEGAKFRLKLLNKGSASVTWTSGNKSVATVSKTGLVKGKKAGKTCVITAKSNGVKYRCRVYVVAEGTGDEYEKATGGGGTGDTGDAGDGGSAGGSGGAGNAGDSGSTDNTGSTGSTGSTGNTGSTDTTTTTHIYDQLGNKIKTPNGWEETLTYKVNGKDDLYKALYNGFERRASNIIIEVEPGTEELYVNYYEGGKRVDYFNQLLHDDRVLSGYANNFSMSYGSGSVTFIPEYKASWDAVTALRFNNFENTKNGEKTLNAVKQLVEKATAGVTSKVEKLEKVYDAIADLGTYRYSNTPGSRNYSQYDATSLLFDGSGVCEAYASLMQIACTVMDMRCILVAGHAYGDNHAWNKVYVNNSWYNFDLTFDDQDRGGAQRDYFMKDDSSFSSDHEWSSKYYPGCPY